MWREDGLAERYVDKVRGEWIFFLYQKPHWLYTPVSVSFAFIFLPVCSWNMYFFIEVTTFVNCPFYNGFKKIKSSKINKN